MSTFIARLSAVFRPFALMAILFGLAAPLAGCGGSATLPAGSTSASGLKMAPMADMPAAVQKAPVTVQQGYQFAVGNPEVLKQIPCYCGCGAMGHTSSYSCYVKGENADGSIQFDTHALGCSICVDITQDTMRLLKEGKALGDIRVYVDNKYSQYGPSNMP